MRAEFVSFYHFLFFSISRFYISEAVNQPDDVGEFASFLLNKLLYYLQAEKLTSRPGNARYSFNGIRKENIIASGRRKDLTRSKLCDYQQTNPIDRSRISKSNSIDR